MGTVQDLGLTRAEADVWSAVAVAANAYLRLNEADPAHPMERAEVCTAFHHIQARLLARPGLRVINAGDEEARYPWSCARVRRGEPHAAHDWECSGDEGCASPDLVHCPGFYG